jgi:hypothetical protein
MWRCLDLVLTDFSGERIARSTKRYIPEDDILHSQSCEKPNILQAKYMLQITELNFMFSQNNFF